MNKPTDDPKEQLNLLISALAPKAPVVIQLSLEDLRELILKAEGSTHKLMTIDDLAEAWGVPKSKIYAFTRKTGPGSIPRIKVGRDIRFDPVEAHEWLKTQNEA